MNQIVLLGPQKDSPTVAHALKLVDAGKRVAITTAGWKEREGELDALREHLDGTELVDLRLYERTEDIFKTDPELQAAWRERQQWLIDLQRLYRARLRHALAATREINTRKGIHELVNRAKEQALMAVRELDRQHLREIRKIQFEHWRRWKPAQRASVLSHREQVAQILGDCSTLLIAGGHIGVLLNRLRLYDIGQTLGNMSLIAWSAGAMALSERVVLFHDHPPEGAGNAEIFDAGLGAYRGVVALPDAQHRLALKKRKRVSILASRMRPAVSVALDEPSVLAWDGNQWHAHGPTRLLAQDGSLEDIPA